ncbi:unnamed protein product, partial [Mesorhabditis belari]|uniref:non-specific serine/threonine protein kinase n=1 Tax=Mesorhabditis belari TaxID=2138241 RepID=A0AAF3J6M4_9BILA
MPLIRPRNLDSFPSSPQSPTSIDSPLSRVSTVSGRECHQCHEEFRSGEPHFKVENTLWHLSCFKCAQCFEELEDKTYFHFEGRNYCQHDFEINYAPICKICTTYILEGHVIKAATGSYHAECFKCDECEGTLDDGMWIVDAQKLCHDCKELKRKQAHYICVKCRQSIDEDELLKVNNDFFHSYHFECTSCKRTLTPAARQDKNQLFCPRCYDLKCEICFDCKRAIDPQNERSVMAMGRHFHVEHFRCVKCNVAFYGKPYFVKNERPYCEEHYIENFGEKCFRCSKGLTGESIRIFEKGWCHGCYVCRGCNRCLNLTDKVLEEDMQPLCKKWNPGVRIRLTKKGINHLKTVAVKLFNEQIANIRGYSSQYPFSQSGITGFVNLQNVRVLQYRPPQFSVVNFLPPRYIVFGLENMDIQIAGSFDGTAPPFQLSGNLDGFIQGMTIAMTAEFIRTEPGLINVRVSNCSTIIQQSNFNIYPTGPTSGLIKAFEGQINDGIRKRIPNMFCRKLKNLVENNSPKIFARLSKTNLGESFKTPIVDDGGIMQKFISDFVDGLYIDNRNIADPIVTEDYFETQMKGEVRYENSDYSTPFYPKPMHTPESSERMLYFYGSDYLFNSLLYHAYQKNKLNIEMSVNNLPDRYKGLLRTSCTRRRTRDLNGGYCIGRLIPALAEAYPDTNASFVLLPHGLPDFQFNGDAGAITLSTRIITYVDDEGFERQVMVASADGQVDLQLSANGGRLSGDMKLNKLAIRLHRSNLADIDPETIEGLAPLAKNFVAPQIGQGMKRGIPFPIKDQLEFVSPSLRVDDGYIELGTDFILNESVLRKKVAEVFRHSMPLGGLFGGNASKAQPLSNTESPKDKKVKEGTEKDARGTILNLQSHTVVIDRKLAEGGFAIVYLVTDKKNRNFALKRQFINDDPRQVEACKRECQIISSLRGHKNIVEYVDHLLVRSKNGVHDYMLLTAYYKNSVLGLMNDRLTHGKGFTPAEVLSIFCDMCEAVARLHHSTTPVIHRDLKVENILVDERNRGAAPIYVLCDFGSATTRVLSTETHQLSQIQEEIERYTTLSYRAPEMIDFYSAKPIGAKVDIWALGVMLYKLCYFSLPFGDSAMAIQNCAFTFPHSPEYPLEIRATIKALLDAELDTRPNIYQTASLAFQAAKRQNPVHNIEKVQSPCLERCITDFMEGRKPTKQAMTPVKQQKEAEKKEEVEVPTSQLCPTAESSSVLSSGHLTTSVNPRLRPKPTNSIPRLPNMACASPQMTPRSARVASTSEPDIPPASVASATIPPPDVDLGPLSCPLMKADASFDGLDEIARRPRLAGKRQQDETTVTDSLHRRNQSDCSTVIKSAFKPYSQTAPNNKSVEGDEKQWNPFTAAPYGSTSEGMDDSSFGTYFDELPRNPNQEVSDLIEEMDGCSIDSRDPFGAAPFEAPSAAERRRMRSERERDDSVGSAGDLARLIQEDSSDMDEVRVASRRRFSYEHIDGVGDDASSDSRARTEEDSNTDDQKLDDDEEDGDATQTTEGADHSDEEGGSRPLLDEDELEMEHEDNDALWIEVSARKCTNPFLCSTPQFQQHTAHYRNDKTPEPPKRAQNASNGEPNERRDTLTFQKPSLPTVPPLEIFQAPATLPRQVTPLFAVPKVPAKPELMQKPTFTAAPPLPSNAPVVVQQTAPEPPKTATLVDLSEPKIVFKERTTKTIKSAPPIPQHGVSSSVIKKISADHTVNLKQEKENKSLSKSMEGTDSFASVHSIASSSVITTVPKGFGYSSPRVKKEKKKIAQRKNSSSSDESLQTDGSEAEMFASALSETKVKKSKHKLRGSHPSVVAVAPTDLKLTPMDVQKQLQKRGSSTKRDDSGAVNASFVNSSFQAEDIDSPPRVRNPVVQKS